MCITDKIAFRTLRAAADFALEQLELHPENPNRPYMCECGDFHLTTKPLFGGKQLTADLVRELAARV